MKRQIRLSGHLPSKRCRLNVSSILSSDGHFVQLSRTILAILAEGQTRNISVKVF